MFNTKNFSVMSYANGFTLWNYQTDDSIDTVKAKDYFNETCPFVRKNDVIITCTNEGVFNLFVKKKN